MRVGAYLPDSRLRAAVVVLDDKQLLSCDADVTWFTSISLQGHQTLWWAPPSRPCQLTHLFLLQRW